MNTPQRIQELMQQQGILLTLDECQYLADGFVYLPVSDEEALADIQHWYQSNYEQFRIMQIINGRKGRWLQ